MDLKDLKKSVGDMTDEELKEYLLGIRRNIRHARVELKGRKESKKVTKEVELSKGIQELSGDQAKDMLAILESLVKKP